ncbi:MAG TPA: HPr family phosphocarrier protein [Candidatus Avilachnospira avistercoris]|nr:HPr family phosphocarrier protein [Candidatus Avilachnospira avistercoris]
MTSSNVVVNLPKEMDRKVAILVQVASQYNSRIHLVCGNKKVNAKSIMGMMTLPLDNDDEITIEAEGSDEEAAVKAITVFLKNDECDPVA